MQKITVLIFFFFYSIIVRAIEPSKIENIRIDGLKHVLPSSVLSILPLKKGDVFTDKKASQAIQSLFSSGFFNDIRIAFQNNDLILYVQERPIITTVHISGIEKEAILYERVITKILKDINIHPGGHYDKALIQKAENLVKSVLLTSGYYSVQMKTTITPINKDYVSVLFSFVLGPKAKVQLVNFIGNKVFKSEDLFKQMTFSDLKPISFLTEGDLCSSKNLSRNFKRLKSFYKDHGYYDFEIKSIQTSLSPDKRKMYLTITVKEGQLYTVKETLVEGEFPDREMENNFRSLIGKISGKTYSEKLVKGFMKQILSCLGHYGYAFANLEVYNDIDREEHNIKLTFNLKPGQRIHVRHINIIGNHKTRDEVIRRQMLQLESSWYDGTLIEISKDNIKRLGYFKNIKIKTLPIEGTPDQMDIEVNVLDERDTSSVSASAGGSRSNNQIVITGTLGEGNMFGSGNNFYANLNTGKKYKGFELSYLNPYLMIDQLLSRSINMQYNAYDPLSTVEHKFHIVNPHANFKVGFPLSYINTAYFGIGMSKYRITNHNSAIPISYEEYIKSEGKKFSFIPIIIGGKHDTRDSLIEPRRGFLLDASAEFTLPCTKSRYSLIDIRSEFYHSFSPGFVLGIREKFIWGIGVSNKVFPVFKNYYAGGKGSIRGYEDYSLGPRDIRTKEAIGGNKLLVTNIELKFPMLDSNLKLLNFFAFLDGGNVWGDKQKIDFTDLRYSYGIGISISTPLGPVRMTLGYPLFKKDGDKFSKWQFQIGRNF